MSRRDSLTVRRLSEVARALFRTVRNENISFLAAAVAYYAFVSLIPLLLIGLAVGTSVGGERLASAVIETVGGLLAPAGEDLVRTAILNASGRGQATIIGLALLLWSGLRLFRGLDTAFSRVYGVEVPERLPGQIKDAGIVLGSIAMAVGAVIVVGGVLPTTLPFPWNHLLAMLSLPAVLAISLFPVYYAFPDVPIGVMEALPGVVFSAGAWTLLVGGFRVYAANAAQFELYGLLGGVLLLVTWLYLAAIVIILGAVLNAVLAGRAGKLVDEPAGPPLRTDGGSSEEGPDHDSSRDRDGFADVEAEIEDLRQKVEERTVPREDLESDLRRYVRRRLRRGHARGWGPYLVLLYGTAMTIAAFVYLSGGWAILAMLIIWLSTLGLYALMIIVGVGLRAVSVPGRAFDWVGRRRS